MPAARDRASMLAALPEAEIVLGDWTATLALDGEAALGFTQLYPSFSSVRMRPIWVLNDLFVAEGGRRGTARPYPPRCHHVAQRLGWATRTCTRQQNREVAQP